MYLLLDLFETFRIRSANVSERARVCTIFERWTRERGGGRGVSSPIVGSNVGSSEDPCSFEIFLRRKRDRRSVFVEDCLLLGIFREEGVEINSISYTHLYKWGRIMEYSDLGCDFVVARPKFARGVCKELNRKFEN